MLIITLALLAPNIIQLVHQSAIPFMIVLMPNNLYHAWQTTLVLLSILFIYISWIAWQKNAVTGGKLTTYLKSFPLSSLEWFIIDYLTLLVANGLFLIPLITIWFYPHPHELQFILNWFLLFFAITSLQWLCLNSDSVKWKHALKPSFPVSIDCIILIRNHLTDTLLKIILCILTMMGGYIVATKTAVGASFTIIIAFAILNYITSPWYFILNREHQQYQSYLRHFPNMQRFLLSLDIGTTLTLLLTFQLILLGPLLIQKHINILFVGILMMMQLPLWILLYFIQSKLKRYRHIITLLTLGLWTFCTMHSF